ncbi:HAD-IA family hydrolase [Mediterraneibacter sp. NSJ-55]|uniref:HAD-IA family hydrolase n=1 Tax=Mediterraneibacter hominis TaxID=2763054 RepID=A0A923RSZ9_9FIRM|nr:HAD-IA family hydrolase [Mediterraneibacter hominis]MBC5689822.1 HAD-IA family hydrolase [Mediterraneibacter hominis]
MNIKLTIYNLLVNRISGIQQRYKKKRNHVRGVGRIGVWMYLLGLNISYYAFRNRKLETVEKYPYFEEKELYTEAGESSISKLEKPEALAEKLAKYDVISFDVFDTLVLRPFSAPTDLFFILGEELGYLDFENIRKEMEWKTRQKKYKKEKHYEVTLKEIYATLEEEAGIPADIQEREAALEESFCFANPYMQRVVEELQKRKTRLIITSDMYLDTEQIKAILKSCGYKKFDAVYVSCEFQKSKNEGTLFEEVKKREGEEKNFIHVGDNYISDVTKPKEYGFSTYHYVNVNAVGMPYRAEDMSAIIGGAYRGMVNARIHNGLEEYSNLYEFGYIYGGLFVVGYCQFIHRQVKHKQLEKILFLARDGYILKKVYELLYPQESERLEYVYWSRLAATKMASDYFRYDYFRRFLYHKMNQKYSIEEILDTMELQDMTESLCKELNINARTELTDKNIEKVKSYLLLHWNEISRHYEEQRIAGRSYMKEILNEAETAAAVDIGWAGSGAVTLDYLINHVWKLNCRITGIIAGSNTCHNVEMNASEPQLQSGKLVSYLYSQRKNRDLWKFHNPDKEHNLYWEMLLDAPHGSLRGFYLNENGKSYCRFKEYQKQQTVEEIQQGILDFALDYQKHFEKYEIFQNISGRDAYAPMLIALQSKNKLKGMREVMDDANLT